MKIKKEVFGLLPGNVEAHQFTAINPAGSQLKIINYGATIQSLLVPGMDGSFADVVLGFDDLAGYLGDHPYIGTTVGRYANRIAGGRFKLDGKEYRLVQNLGVNHIHGGLIGFDKVLWDATEFADDKGAGVTLTYFSHDMEEGYPGNLKLRITYTLDVENCLVIDYEGTVDMPSPLNPTNHSYFNLGGGGEPVYEHELQIESDSYVETLADGIPTGNLLKLDGGALDFRKQKPVGKDIDSLEGGYDHCYVLGEGREDPRLAARVVHPKSGRVMEVFTTEPGMQFYTSNFLDGIIGKGGKSYGKHQALCLETQHFPDSPNQPDFPDTILRPGETYTQKTIYKFSTLTL